MKHKKEKGDACRKCLKYIERNDLPRLKSYLKKHHLDVNNLRLDGDNTLLHAACKHGCDAIVSYLLRKSANCMLFNAEGNLPIHLAVKCALSGHKYAYTDLVLPLVHKCPSSLDVPNADGYTCRELMEPFKASLRLDCEDSDTDSSVDDTEPSNDADWQRKLAEELTDEYLENCGRYEDAYHIDAEQSETWDQWADRISHERKARQQSIFLPPAANGHKRHTSNDKRHPKRPKISEEKQRAFEENIRHEAEKRNEELTKIRNMIHKKVFEIYELLCSYLFGDKPNEERRDRILAEASKQKSQAIRRKLLILENKAVQLQFRDIPWPVKADAILKQEQDISEDELTEFLFHGMDTGSETYEQHLKKEQRKWHPDRFLQKCGARLKDSDKASIIETVTKISQVLNKLSDARK